MIFFLVVIFDQATKIWVKTGMTIGQRIYPIDGFNKFIIYFVENPGMAFGMTIGGEYGKLILSVFRIVAVLLIGVYVVYLTKQKANKGLITSLALIFAGAMGNIIDSVFYGEIFTDSHNRVAEFVSFGKGYGTWFHGRVVDFLQFPLIRGVAPDWIPILGGEEFVFFRPIFNIADVSITIGVFMIIVFQRDYFTEPEKEEGEDALPESIENLGDDKVLGVTEDTTTKTANDDNAISSSSSSV